jgi:DNA-binding response OmpR family regulator
MKDCSKERLLVVDDDLDLLRDVKALLEKTGYQVQTASNGRAALKLTDSVQFDLVLLDINFPELSGSTERSMDGIEVLRAIRDASKLPVIMLSATNISSVKAMALILGADDYMHKPFDPVELSARIEAVLRRSHPDVSKN